MARKSFTTTVDEDLQKAFKKSCIERDEKMNDVLEAFMHSYINEEFVIKKEVKYTLQKGK
ncbi:hypothetical protein [Lederbergia ruris]|uniref:hypothetical protein n=1 Tax=Lederbergia ruris TaxID=217495 RepID=UPI00399FD574